MKQKIVIKVCISCDKCRTKALKVVAKAHGLISVGVTGDDEKLEVVGDGVDIACLVKCLRRKICYAEILQVEIVKDKKPEAEKPEVPPQKEGRAAAGRADGAARAAAEEAGGGASCRSEEADGGSSLAAVVGRSRMAGMQPGGAVGRELARGGGSRTWEDGAGVLGLVMQI